MKKMFRKISIKTAVFVCIVAFASCAQNIDAVSENQILESEEQDKTSDSESQEKETDSPDTENVSEEAQDKNKENENSIEETEKSAEENEAERKKQESENLVQKITFEEEEGFKANSSYQKEITLTGKESTWELSGGNVSKTNKITGEQSLLLRVFETAKPISAKTNIQHSSLSRITFEAKGASSVTFTAVCSTKDGKILTKENIKLKTKEQTFTLNFPKIDSAILTFMVATDTDKTRGADAIIDNICFYTE